MREEFNRFFEIIATLPLISLAVLAAILLGVAVTVERSIKGLLKAKRPTTVQKSPRPTRIPMTPAAIEKIIDREAKQAIRLKRHWPPGKPHSGNSWLGGLPTLPAELSWPTNEKTGLSMHHLAQIDLSDLPQLNEGARLPTKGTLWFFADIDEEVVWDDGPDTTHSRVLFWPESVVGLPAAPVPDNLPEVDHSCGEMTGMCNNYRPPKFSVYPRWPVTAHETLAWEFSDSYPEDVTDRPAYDVVLQGRKSHERWKIVGDPKKHSLHFGAISHELLEERSNPHGRRFSFRKRVYAPHKWGGTFPYSTRLCMAVLDGMMNHAKAKVQSAELHIDWAKQRDEKPRQEELADLEKFSPFVVSVKEYKNRLDVQDPESPLSVSQQKKFDEWMKLCFCRDDLFESGDTFVGDAVVDLVALAVTMPTVLDPIPATLVAHVADIVLPEHEHAEHFILGPKGCASNPTSGSGIRLAQFGSDYALKFMFCDVGIIDYWIDEEYLKEGRWDRAWAATAGG